MNIEITNFEDLTNLELNKDEVLSMVYVTKFNILDVDMVYKELTISNLFEYVTNFIKSGIFQSNPDYFHLMMDDKNKDNHLSRLIDDNGKVWQWKYTRLRLDADELPEGLTNDTKDDFKLYKTSSSIDNGRTWQNEYRILEVMVFENKQDYDMFFEKWFEQYVGIPEFDRSDFKVIE